jgi:hypothetical protein
MPMKYIGNKVRVSLANGYQQRVAHSSPKLTIAVFSRKSFMLISIPFRRAFGERSGFHRLVG